MVGAAVIVVGDVVVMLGADVVVGASVLAVVGAAVVVGEVQVGPLVMVPTFCMKGRKCRPEAAAHKFVDAQP